MTELTSAITNAVTLVLAVAADVITFIVGQPILLFGIAVAFALSFVSVGRKILGR